MNAALAQRTEGDLLDILEAGDYSRLRPGDYQSLVALRDHYSRRLEQVAAAVKRCPATPDDPVDLDPFGDDVAEAGEISVDDRGPGDEVGQLPGMSVAPLTACVVLGVTGATSLASAYLLYRSVVWTVAVLFG